MSDNSNDSPPKAPSLRPGANGNIPPIATRWKPGVSQNPGGKPKTKHISEALRRIGRIAPEDLARIKPMTVDEATALKVRRELVAKGRMPVKLLHEALDRIEGPVEREDERASIAIEKLDIVVHFGAGGTDVRVLPPKSERDE